MADSKPLIFVSQLKKFLGEDPTSYSSNDEIYLSAIITTTDLFESIVRYSFTKQEYIEYFDGYPNSKKTLILKAFPVDKVASFKVYLLQDSTDFSVELDNAKYSINHTDGSIELNTHCMQGSNTIKVTYTAGYEPSTNVDVVDNPLDLTLERALGLHIPETLKVAAIHQAAKFASFMQDSVCSTNKKPNVLSTARSFRNTFNLNDTAMLLLSKYVNKRLHVRMV